MKKTEITGGSKRSTAESKVGASGKLLSTVQTQRLPIVHGKIEGKLDVASQLPASTPSVDTNTNRNRFDNPTVNPAFGISNTDNSPMVNPSFGISSQSEL